MPESRAAVASTAVQLAGAPSSTVAHWQRQLLQRPPRLRAAACLSSLRHRYAWVPVRHSVHVHVFRAGQCVRCGILVSGLLWLGSGLTNVGGGSLGSGLAGDVVSCCEDLILGGPYLGRSILAITQLWDLSVSPLALLVPVLLPAYNIYIACCMVAYALLSVVPRYLGCSS